MTWVVTVPLWRQGRGVPIAERIEQLERFKAMTGQYSVPFDTEADASAAAYQWSQVLGFSVEAKRKANIPDEE